MYIHKEIGENKAWGYMFTTKGAFAALLYHFQSYY